MNYDMNPSSLVFSGGEHLNEDGPDVQAVTLHTLAQSVPGPSSAEINDANDTSPSIAGQNVSTYVKVFEDMVCTVIKEERHLLDDDEVALLTVFAHLSYNARYLMVKLLLRKQETWHRLDALKYEDELGSVSTIIDAIDELCRVGPEPSDSVKEEESEEQEVVNLTMTESVAKLQEGQVNTVTADAGSPEPSEKRTPALARCEQEMNLRSLLECLTVEELKNVAKQLKVKISQRKDDLIKHLLGTSSSQSTLTSFAFKVTPSKGHGYRQTTLPSCKSKPQQARLREIVLGHIIRCIRVDDEFFRVIHRVHLVYFRITQYTPGILVAALLTRFGKRAYAGYDYERTKNIWPTRQELLDYEKVLLLEGQIDALLAGNGPLLGGPRARSVARSLQTPITPGNANNDREGEDENLKSDEKKTDTARKRGACMVKDIFDQMYPRWQNLVETIGAEEGRPGGLERFHHGHVLTRIVYKGSAALGILREYERELGVLETLLAQKRWRRGQRGRWHERRVLILSAHLAKDGETVERALDAAIEGLKDPDTHLVHRPKLQRRLRQLENKLKIPVDERHTCDGFLAEADEVTFEAVRLKHRASSLKLDRTGRCIDASMQSNQDIKRYCSPVITPMKPDPNLSVASSPRRKSPVRYQLTSTYQQPSSRQQSDIQKGQNGKSCWLGRNGEVLTVEQLALQYYEEQGFKGVHCETRVIATLFGLLFWDIIFTAIPGAFETPYQTAPLDIAEDSFYHARTGLMEERLAAIETGKGADLVREVDAKHRASGTWCVGIQWDLFSSEDLVDIVKCIGGKALSVICRVLCEDYTFGMSGGPDLFLWNAEKCTCKFVEVKGPGDSLQENQRIWIDVLLKAPVAVEVCHVKENGDEADRKSNARTPRSTRKKGKKTPRKMKEILVNPDDTVDSLPVLLADPSMALEEPSMSGVDPRGVASSATVTAPPTFIEGASSPLKRKAGPRAMSPTPSKKQKK